MAVGDERLLEIKIQEGQDVQEIVQDIKYAHVALFMHLIDAGQILNAQKVQKAQTPKKSLADIFIQEGMITLTQSQTIAEHTKAVKMLTCPLCQKHFMITAPQEGKSYKCPPCQVPLDLFSGRKKMPSSAQKQTAPKEVELLGAAKGLDMQIAEEGFDEMCDKRMGDYKILARLGSGSMGVVYKAEQIKLQRIVALKMLLPRFSADETYIKRFLIEARSAAKLNHPNILQIYDVGSVDGRHYFSMEFLQGESIGEILRRMEKIPVGNSLEIILQIIQAFTEMYDHKMVHRDIKPDNIMLTTKGIAKLADLGLAKSIDYSKELASLDGGAIMGTPYYIAPEQITNPTGIDHRADIYALGASFFRMVTGTIPFYHQDPKMALKKVTTVTLPLVSKINPAVPDSLSWVIDKMVQKKPEERFQTPSELYEVLSAIKVQIGQSASAQLGSGLLRDIPAKIEINGPIDTSSLEFASVPDSPPPPPYIPLDIPPPPPDLPIPDSYPDPIAPPELEPKKKTETNLQLPRGAAASPAKDRPSTRISARTAREEKPKAIAPLEEPSREPQQPNRMGMIVAAVLVLCVIGYFAFSGKKQPPRKITPAERKAKEYEEKVIHEIDAALRANHPEGWQKGIALIRAFRNVDPKNFKEEELKKFESSLENKIVLAKAEHRIQTMETEIKKWMDEKNFPKALERWKKEPEFPSLSLEKHRANLHQEIVAKAQELCQTSLREAGKLEGMGQLAAAISLLSEAQKNQLPENIELLSKQIQENKNKIVELEKQERLRQETAKKVEALLALKGAVYPLLIDKNFAEAKKLCAKKEKEKERERDKKGFLEAMAELKEEVSLLEELEKTFWRLLGRELKERDRFSFVFAKDEKGQEEVIDGKIVSVTTKQRRVMIMTPKKTIVSRPVDSLSWECKKEILKIRLDDDRILYLLLLQALIDKELKTVALESPKLSEELSKKMEDKLCYSLALYIKELAKEQRPSDLVDVLEKSKAAYLKSEIWGYLKNGLAQHLFETGTTANRKNATLFFKLIVDHFPDTPNHAEAKEKWEQLK